MTLHAPNEKCMPRYEFHTIVMPRRFSRPENAPLSQVEEMGREGWAIAAVIDKERAVTFFMQREIAEEKVDVPASIVCTMCKRGIESAGQEPCCSTCALIMLKGTGASELARLYIKNSAVMNVLRAEINAATRTYHEANLAKDFHHSLCCPVGGLMSGSGLSGCSGESPCPCGIEALITLLRAEEAK